jgi:hypothetical protein
MRAKVFDLPFLDGADITGLPLVDRKARLDPFLIAAAEMLRYSAWVRLNPCRKSTINKTPTFPNVIYLTLFPRLIEISSQDGPIKRDRICSYAEVPS